MGHKRGILRPSGKRYASMSELGFLFLDVLFCALLGVACMAWEDRARKRQERPKCKW